MSACGLCPIIELSYDDGEHRAAVAAALVLGVGLGKSGAQIAVCPRCRAAVERFAKAHNETISLIGTTP